MQVSVVFDKPLRMLMFLNETLSKQCAHYLCAASYIVKQELYAFRLSLAIALYSFIR